MPFAGCTADVLHDPLRRRITMHGFLSHLHSLMVTMSQKSFVPQAAKSVSQELMSDTDLKRGRITALRLSRDRLGRHRPRSIRIAPIDIAKTRRRERWISQRAVIRVCDAAGTAKSPIKVQENPQTCLR